MRKLGVVVFLSMLGVAAHAFAEAREAQNTKATPPPSTEARVNPGARALDPEIAAQHRRIQSLLPPETKQKIARMVPEFQQQTRKLKPGTDLRALATVDVRKQFPKVPPRQIDVLVFTLLNETYAALPPSSSGDMSTQQQMELQQAMQQKSQFEEVFSNMLKSISDTNDAIVQNIKP